MSFSNNRFKGWNRAGVVAALALLVVAAAVVNVAQHHTRAGITDRFAAGTRQFTSFIAATMTTTTQADAAQATRSLSGRRISVADLREFRGIRSPENHIAVFDGSGRLLGSLGAMPTSATTALRPHIVEALLGRAGVSGVLASGHGPLIELAIPFETTHGRRVVTDSVPLPEISVFLNSLSSLTVIPGSKAFVIDASGRVLTSSANQVLLNQHRVQSALLTALRERSVGGVRVAGVDSHFASYLVPNTAWRLVLTAPDAQLYAAVDGTNHWFPWALIAALLAATTAAAFSLRRMERNNHDLAAAQETIEAHSATLEGAVRERTGELEVSRLETVKKLALASEFHDDDTHRHTERVGLLAGRLAAELGLPPEYVALIRSAAPLHDVGKMAISDSILLNPGKLTAKEFTTMQCHSQIGAQILADSTYDVLQMGAEIAGSHHERWDGTGYPSGLSGQQIPLSGRITAVADVFDALTHERPYKRAWPLAQAVDEIRRSAGVQFDPQVVAAFLSAAHSRLLSADEGSPEPGATDAELQHWLTGAEK